MGNSRVSLWVDQPVFNKETNSIYFSGTIPNGFVAGPQELFTIKTRGSDILGITISGSAYLNDGKGTKISIRATAPKEGVVSTFEISDDKEPPEGFTPLITQDENLTEGKWSVLFLTNDKSSGIERYEVAEAKSRFWGLISTQPEYVVATSPHVLQDQERQSFVYVRAIDQNGNERVVKISPERTTKTYKILLISLILGVLLAIVLALRRH